MEWLVTQERGVRLAAFFGVLAAMLLAEGLWPKRRDPMRRALRWSANLPMAVMDTLVVRVLLPLGAVGAALWAQDHHAGLFNVAPVPPLAAGVLSFLALDCLIYGQHRLFHAVPVFWRLHRMHHSDVAIDTTTGVRFHPVEIVLSMLVKIGAVVALGAPAAAVVVFEIALNATSMFNHANLDLPPWLDALLRRVLVTPDMHRVHHSVHRDEHDSNFGFNLTWWDHLFGSYTAQPREGHDGMTIGLSQFRSDREQRLDRLLLQPRVAVRRDAAGNRGRG